ncbi:MAG: glucosaminidase domain-containing protein [Alphaproteobacteria bacterium]
MGSNKDKKSMGTRNHPFIVFAAVVALGAVVYGAATAYPVERTVEDEVRLAPSRTSLLGELPRRKPAPISFVSVDNVEGLQRAFEKADFRLAPIRRGNQGVPRVMLAALPDDYHMIGQVDVRKRLFFKTMLPLVLRVNEEIVAERRRLVGLITILEAGHDLKPADREWIERLAERYRTNPGEFATLLRRVDAVSPGLAIAQSIEESGWGRSRFARNGNALFGQRVWSEGAGLVPQARADGETFEVRVFEHLIDSVRAYALNLNRHPAYADYRVERARQRATEVALDPYALAQTLVGYSERREQYVETLQSIIRSNRLELARLKPRLFSTQPTIEVSSSR